MIHDQRIGSGWEFNLFNNRNFCIMNNGENSVRIPFLDVEEAKNRGKK